jgi:hypothetical protein
MAHKFTNKCILMPHHNYFQLRGLASGVAVSTAYFSGFLSVFSFGLVSDALGSGLTYLWCAISAAAFLAIAHFYLPETKGKTEAEIAELYNEVESKC